MQYCRVKIDKIEKVWNRKLEDANESDDQDSFDQDRDDDNQLDHENFMDKLLSKGQSRFLSRSLGGVQKERPDFNEFKEELNEELNRPVSKDDSDAHRPIPETNDFMQNNYWRMENEYQLDDLLEELKDQQN